MIRQRFFLTAVICALAAPPVLAQSRGDVITPPTTNDTGVIRPPAEHVDPGIQKGKPPEQSQLPPDEDKQKRDRLPGPKTDPRPKIGPGPKMDGG